MHTVDHADNDPRGKKYLIPTRPEFTHVQREKSELERFSKLGSLMRGDGVGTPAVNEAASADDFPGGDQQPTNADGLSDSAANTSTLLDTAGD